MGDPFEDVEMTYSESQDEQEFNDDDDAGPPDLNEEVVLKKDKKAIKMERLEKLGVIQLVPCQNWKDKKVKERSGNGVQPRWCFLEIRQGKWTQSLGS